MYRYLIIFLTNFSAFLISNWLLKYTINSNRIKFDFGIIKKAPLICISILLWNMGMFFFFSYDWVIKKGKKFLLSLVIVVVAVVKKKTIRKPWEAIISSNSGWRKTYIYTQHQVGRNILRASRCARSRRIITCFYAHKKKIINMFYVLFFFFWNLNV